ncbi:MAG: pyridoxine 5'-phosphate synthase [Acidobacteriota bacterium]
MSPDSPQSEGRPQPTAVHLSVNVDHIATLRQARQAPYPDPVDAARIAEAAGAHGITVHLRGDRRHIQDDDVRRLAPTVAGKLNLEIAVEPEMLALAREVRPAQVTLVPERPGEVTTEGGLDLTATADEVAGACTALSADGMAVSLFLDPDSRQIERMLSLAGAVSGPLGFELNTDAYSKAVLDGDAARVAHELKRLRDAAALGAAENVEVYAGHGLTTANVGPVAKIEPVRELNIGHWLVARAALVGLGEAVREMLAAIKDG